MSHYPANNTAYLYLFLLPVRWLPAGDAYGPGRVMTGSDCQAAGMSSRCPGRVLDSQLGDNTQKPLGPMGLLGRCWGGYHHPQVIVEERCPGAGSVSSQAPPTVFTCEQNTEVSLSHCPSQGGRQNYLPQDHPRSLQQSPACSQICEGREERRPSSDVTHLHRMT